MVHVPDISAVTRPSSRVRRSRVWNAPYMPTSQQPEDSKKIFVISPIDKLRDGVDYTKIFLEQIVRPAAEKAGFGPVVRGDEINTPGSIMAKVVIGILDAGVCVADLTDRNPNVMYEVAIAHAADKQVILLQQEEGGPPFDFADQRVIRYGILADAANRARDALAAQLENSSHDIEDERLVSALNPVRAVFRKMKTREDARPAEGEILDRLDMLGAQVRALGAGGRTLFLGSDVNPAGEHSGFTELVITAFGKVGDMLPPDTDLDSLVRRLLVEGPRPDVVSRLRAINHALERPEFDDDERGVLALGEFNRLIEAVHWRPRVKPHDSR